MIETTRPEPFFIADDPALDFLNSVASPWAQSIEWLRDGQDLLAWLEQAGSVPPHVLRRMRREASPKALDDVAGQACELREWFRGFVAAHAGRRIEPSALDDLENLNRLLAHDESRRQLEARPVSKQNGDLNPALQWRRERRWPAPGALLLPLAEAIGDAICHADFERVRECEGPTCTLWFHDISKNHTRRWCSMAVCGNRAKAAAHRAKQRSARSDRSD